MGLFWHSHMPRGVLVPAAHSPLLSSGYLWMSLRRSYSRSLSGQNRFRKTSRGTRSWLGRWKTSSRSVPLIVRQAGLCDWWGRGQQELHHAFPPSEHKDLSVAGIAMTISESASRKGFCRHGDRPGLSPWGSAQQLEVWLCSQHGFG